MNIFQRFKNSLLLNKRENFDKMGLCLFEKELYPIAKRNMDRMTYISPSNGQCIPGSRKLFVSYDGVYHTCEKGTEDICIGNFETGINISFVYEILKDWTDLFIEKCNNCWAVRLCGKCFAGFDQTNKFKNIKIDEFCYGKKKSIVQNLVNYCSICESHSQSFSYLKDIYNFS